MELRSYLTRVRLVAGLSALYALGVFLHAQQASLPELIKVADDLYVIQNVNHTVAEIGQYGGNVTVILTRESVILVDAKNERMHDDIVAKVKSVTDRPIRYMILTHNHGDHSGGSAPLQTMGVSVVSSIGSRENMARTNAPGRAHIAYTGYSELEVGGTRLQLREFRGHTKGDTVVTLPASRTVIAGDLVATPDTIPPIVSYADGGNWTELVESLDTIARIEFDVLIAGRGPNLTKAEFLKYRDKAAAIRDRFRTLNREQKTQDEIARILMAEFQLGHGSSGRQSCGHDAGTPLTVFHCEGCGR